MYLTADLIHCYFCVFSGNMQRFTVAKHNESKDHKQAEEADQLRRQLYDVPKSLSLVRKCIYFTQRTLLPNKIYLTVLLIPS